MTKTLTDRERLFLDVLFSEECMGNVKTAMSAAGYPANTPTSTVLKSLSDEIVDRTKAFLGQHSAEAAFHLLYAMRASDSAGVINKIKAAESILNRAGVKDKEDGLASNAPKGGIIILPAKKITVEIDDNTDEG